MQISRSPWIALCLSFVIHAGLGLVLFLGVSTDDYGDGESPFALESCVLLQEGIPVDLPPGLASDHRRVGREDNEEQENGNFTATVTDLLPRDLTDEKAANGQNTTSGHDTTGNPPGAQSTIPGGMGETGVAFCGVGGKGNRVVYVIDRSLSMGLNGTYRHACDQLLTSLARLPAEARFQVLLYNRHAEPLRVNGTTDLLAANAETREQVNLLVSRARSEGATDHLEALKTALRLHPDVIYLATDGDELTQNTIEAVTNYNKGKSVIHAIEVTRSPDADRASLLKQLANANGGTYRVVVVKSKSE
jgi:hypothetical protein